jgi:hypothetical protein
MAKRNTQVDETNGDSAVFGSELPSLDQFQSPWEDLSHWHSQVIIVHWFPKSKYFIINFSFKELCILSQLFQTETIALKNDDIIIIIFVLYDFSCISFVCKMVSSWPTTVSRKDPGGVS